MSFLYTTFVPLLGSSCLNYPIILNYAKLYTLVDCTKALLQTSTYIWATSHIYLTLIEEITMRKLTHKSLPAQPEQRNRNDGENTEWVREREIRTQKN